MQKKHLNQSPILSELIFIFTSLITKEKEEMEITFPIGTFQLRVEVANDDD